MSGWNAADKNHENLSIDVVEQLRTANEKYERVKKEFDDFTYIVSHDLQSPLRRIVSYSGLLYEYYDKKIDDRSNKYFQYVAEGGAQMQDMIENLLLYSRINTRANPFTKVAVSELVDSALTLTSVLKNISIHQYYALPRIFCDREQMIQALYALIDNAIKFQQRDQRPEIWIEATHHREGPVISIRDNGIGILPGKQDEIFNVFRRLNKPEDYPGLGMGLAMVKKIMERHGGTVHIESEFHKGSTFFLKFPNED